MNLRVFKVGTTESFDIVAKQTKGDEKMKCPACSDTRSSKHKTDKSLSYNIDKETGYCHHCQATFVGEGKQKKEKQKEYVRPVFNNTTTLSEKLVKWFQGRGISQQTLIDLKISEGSAWMPQTSKEENTIQFNYFRDGELINVKYRDGAKNFKMVKDAELIFYNLDAIKGEASVVICEGEIDALSWHEAGVTNVLSVPNGASKATKLDYLENCYEQLKDKTTIYLSTDDDEPGRMLRDELARRFGYEICRIIDFDGLKDANEYLIYHDAEKLKLLIENAREFPIDGVYSVMDIYDDLYHIYKNGLPQGPKTGDTKLDGHIGFMAGEMTVITGIPGHGKSIFLDQIALGLAIESGWKFAACSPESYPIPLYFSRLIKRIIGRKFSKNHMSEAEFKQVTDWLKDKFYMIMPPEGITLDSVLEKARVLVMQKGVNGLIIDPWNRIEKNQPAHLNEGQWVAICLTKIIEFARRSGVHVFLVAHPTKMQKDKQNINYLVPNMYSISGSAHFFNMTHNGLTVYRNNETQKTELHIQKVKWEHLGKIGMVEYKYNVDNTRFDDVLVADHTNWINTRILKTEQLAKPNWTADIESLFAGDDPPF